MTAPGGHPGPPPDLPTRTPLLKAISGPWIRFHNVDPAPIHFSRGGVSRFNDSADDFGVLYVAEDFCGAFIETFGRRLDVRSVTSSSLQSTGVAEVSARRPLKLVDLASAGGAARLSADARLMSGDIGVSQAWSRALWDHPIGADGLYYRLRHDPARCGCAIFDRARKALTVRSLGNAWRPDHRRDLTTALDMFQFGLIVE